MSDHAVHSEENRLVRFAARPVLSPSARNLSKPCWSKSLIEEIWIRRGHACVQTKEQRGSMICRSLTFRRFRRCTCYAS